MSFWNNYPNRKDWRKPRKYAKEKYFELRQENWRNKKVKILTKEQIDSVYENEK